MPDPLTLFPLHNSHDGGKAERERLAARAVAALYDLANLDGSFAELAGIAHTELRALIPGPIASAGPTDPIDPPHK
ncbi:MAG: hypothetical protein WCJ30_10445 [Deltaproteobacteria bacterium]